MLLQTNSYIVPKDKRSAHLNLMRRFRQVLGKLGCDHFEVFEQVGANWSGGDTSGRFVQLMKFRDRKHCQAVQLAEKSDPAAQQLVRDFCELINFPYQEQQGLFAHGYYQAFIEPMKVKPSDLAFHADPSGKDAPDAAHAADAPQTLEPDLHDSMSGDAVSGDSVSGDTTSGAPADRKAAAEPRPAKTPQSSASRA